MLKKTLFLFIASMIMTSSAFAAVAESKIAVFDLRVIIVESTPGKGIQNELKKKFDLPIKELEAQQAKVQQLQTSFEKQGMMLSAEAKQDKELEFKRELRNLQENSQIFQQKYNAEQEKLLAPLFTLLGTIISDYAKKQSYTIVFDLSANSGVRYVDEKINITKSLIDEVNKKWKK